jgi:hypothetical protein
VSDDLADQDEAYGGLPERGTSVALRLAEAYPTIPIMTVLAELRHADLSVPIGADDRAEIITRLVEARLAQHAQGSGDDPAPWS